RIAPQMAPYHLRLDWLMWFAAMSSPAQHPWIEPFLIKLLQNDTPTLKLLRQNPFAHARPAFVRARLYRYRFSTARERRETGQCWMRDLVGDYVPPVRLSRASEPRTCTTSKYARSLESITSRSSWCRGPESNRRHHALQVPPLT